MRFFQFLVSGLLMILSFSGSVFAQNPEFGEWFQLIPSRQIPSSLEINRSNNNLDLIRFKEKYYLAFRTAPSHFASSQTRIYVLSSPDLAVWNYETGYVLGYDMREPRFAILGDTLCFYFFEAGKNPLAFKPRHLWTTHSSGNGDWTQLHDVGLDGYVPWRVRSRRDTLYLSGYYGVNLYKNEHEGAMRLFTSTDGYHFQPISAYPQMTRPNCEEGEFIFDKEGNLWGTIRMEGEGGMVFFADKNDITRWKTREFKKKWDSALLFLHEDQVYLLSRRNLDGDADHTGEKFPDKLRKPWNLLRYSLTRKVTSLFKLDKQNLDMIHICDLPSTGDNAFPGIAQVSENKYLVMNYTNNPSGLKKNWIRGQLSRTNIYWSFLTFH